MARMILVDTIGPTLTALAVNTVVRATSAMEEGALRVENYAKTNAPWADRTGEARNGLTAEVYEEGGEIVLELYHTAEHGRWLELIQDGNFAIIMPTLEALGPEILREAGASVTSIEGVV